MMVSNSFAPWGSRAWLQSSRILSSSRRFGTLTPDDSTHGLALCAIPHILYFEGSRPVSLPGYLRHHWSCRRYGIDSKRESIDLAHDDAFSGGNGDGGNGVPQLAVHEDFSGRRERGFGNSDFAN